jgi:DoxX-like family
MLPEAGIAVHNRSPSGAAGVLGGVFTTYLAVTALAATAHTLAAAVDVIRARFVLENMRRYGVPLSWLPALGLAKAAGAAGLLAG